MLENVTLQLCKAAKHALYISYLVGPRVETLAMVENRGQSPRSAEEGTSSRTDPGLPRKSLSSQIRQHVRERSAASGYRVASFDVCYVSEYMAVPCLLLVLVSSV